MGGELSFMQNVSMDNETDLKKNRERVVRRPDLMTLAGWRNLQGYLFCRRPHLGDIVTMFPANPERNNGNFSKLFLEKAIWPNAVIPYEMDQTLAERHEVILRAMRHIETNSHYRFRSRTNEKEYLTMSNGKGCFVIRDGKEIPRVSLGMACESFGSTLHELLYAIGFDLEHNRHDRDEHLDIYLYTMKEELRSQFIKRPDVFKNERERKHWSEECPFDFDSIMLYGSQTCSVKPGVESLKSKDGGLLLEPSDKRGLSVTDKKKLRYASKVSFFDSDTSVDIS